LEYLGLESHWSLAHTIKTRSDGRTYTESYSQAMLAYLVARNAQIHARHQHQPPAAREPYFAGIICGHTHVPEIRQFRSPVDVDTGESIGPEIVTYYNTGHWTGRPSDGASAAGKWHEHGAHPTCTGVVEHLDGRMEPIRWVPGQGIVSCLQRGESESYPQISKLRA